MTLRAQLSNWQNSLQGLQGRLRFYIQDVGQTALFGLAMLLCAAILGVTALTSAIEKLDRLNSRLAHLEKKVSTQRTLSSNPQMGLSADGLEPLPAAEAKEQTLINILALARNHGLTIDSGVYQQANSQGVQRASNSRLVKYAITLPAQGTYPALRNWLAEVMNQTPSLALDEFSLRRDNSNAPTIDAHVRFTLFFEER